jgi:murein DD-endopeptidase MepM/ murein hydrolase activator NlpD
MNRSNKLSKILSYIFIIFSIFIFTYGTNAQTIDELKAKIENSNNNIKNLEKEIKGFQNQIEYLGKEADSLKNTLASLDLTKKKLEADISITQNKIEATNLEIKELSLQIDDKTDRITDSRRTISQSLVNIRESDTNSIFETLLSSKSFGELWQETDNLNSLQTSISNRIKELNDIKSSLEDNKKKTEIKKAELISLEKDLENQKKIVATTVQEKNSLLKDTRNTEADYKKVLAKKQAQKDAFERELMDYESALKIAIDPSKIPHTGSGVLLWPLLNVKITQYFGNTPFSTKNPQIYNGKGHTGVDFAASIGTPIKASLGGVVSGVANTDIVPGCYSYGKWIMIDHPNGLSTLYAHLSLQTVSKGDAVTTGQIIGYSGNTGYTTGPHLHFGVYATQGVRIMNFENSKNCKGVLIPSADIKAYLNPLSFL